MARAPDPSGLRCLAYTVPRPLAGPRLIWGGKGKGWMEEEGEAVGNRSGKKKRTGGRRDGRGRPLSFSSWIRHRYRLD